MNKEPKKIEKKEEIKKTPEKKLEVKVKKKKKRKKKVKDTTTSNPISKGLNLIPTMSKEEVLIEESKKKINVGSIASLLLLVLVSLGIIGWNILAKLQVNNAQEELNVLENSMLDQSQKILDNTEILERVMLYKEIQKAAYSPKEVIEYINDVASKSGPNSYIKDFSFGSDLSFTFSGSANDFEGVSKLWYLLTHDANVETVSLKSVGKNIEGVSFAFEGKLLFDEFLILSEE